MIGVFSPLDLLLHFSFACSVKSQIFVLNISCRDYLDQKFRMKRCLCLNPCYDPFSSLFLFLLSILLKIKLYFVL
jgi:hypothetical protein